MATVAQEVSFSQKLDQLAPGMPALDNVKEVVDLVSPKHVNYKILKTTETDAYDPIPALPKKHSKRKSR